MLGLAWALTTLAAYPPPILGRYTGSETLVGLVLAAEGVFALTLPLVIGRGATRPTCLSAGVDPSCSSRSRRWQPALDRLDTFDCRTEAIATEASQR